MHHFSVCILHVKNKDIFREKQLPLFCTHVNYLRTFWYVLVGLTGRAQDICVVRVSFQLSSELLFTAV